MTEAIAPGRHARRRQRTRDALVAAAQEVMAQKGYEAATIADITETADVALGSFYNHFESKEQIMEAAALSFLKALGTEIDAQVAPLNDAVKEMAVASYTSMSRGITQPNYGWFMVRNHNAIELITEAHQSKLLRDLQRGIDSGQMRCSNPQCAATMIIGAIHAVVSDVLRGSMGKEAMIDCVETILIAVGVSEPELEEAMALVRENAL